MAGERDVPASVHLLGDFALLGSGGAPLALPTRKSQALLARLARLPGAALSRAELAGLLWPDVPDDQGRQSLRQALTAVRRTLGEGVLAATGDVVALAPGALDVDVARLDAALRPGATGAAEALGEVRGPFLHLFPPVAEPFDDWVHAERAALTARVLEAARLELDRLAAAGRIDEGLALAERALALDPAFEPAHRASMRLAALRGDRAAALRAHDRCREALQRAMGIAPSAETEALRREIAAAGAAGPARPHAPDRRPSLGVLPFEVLSAAPDHRAVARSLEQDVLVELSRFRNLDVIAGGGPGDGEGARPAGADWLVRGTVHVGEARLRLTAGLVEAATGRQVWGDRLEADVADLLAVPDRLARAVAGTLALRIDEAELASARRRPPEDREAYACWLTGLQLVHQGSLAADLEARRLFERALSLHPGFARAWTGLSLSYFNDWSCAAWERWDENEREALRCAEEAVRLDPRDHVAHCILARVWAYRREFDLAAEHLARALALNAADPEVLAHLALVRAYLGEPEQGRELALAARRLHPVHPAWYFMPLAVTELLARNPRDALAWCSRAPDAFVDSRALLAACCGHLGELDAGREHAQRFVARFRADITRGGSPGLAEAVGWMLQVTPLRRDADRAYLLEGLALAGLGATSPAAGAPG